MNAFVVLTLLLAADPSPSAADITKRLGRGINLGNALEAPKEGDWGLTLEADHFRAIKAAGFRSVRLPVKWSAHAAADAPYAIDAAFFARVDWALDQAHMNGLAVVLNVHHYNEIDADPAKHLPRLVGLWTQIAERYKARPPEVVFELLNEPHDKLTEELWQASFPQVLAAVRKTNPTRAVIIGPGKWNGIDALPKLTLPADDKMLIATVHYYGPFEFTHQGASWVKGSDKWKGRTWDGKPEEVARIAKDFDKAAGWAKANGRPILLGEFGAFQDAPMDSRARWTRAVAREAEKHGWAWAYWEFAAGFGAYDKTAKAWRAPLLKALIGEPAA